MDYRSGKCSQCGAEYKIPASFAHNVARCKLCKGVVHLGAPPAGAAVPRARPAPAPAAVSEAREQPAAPARPPARPPVEAAASGTPVARPAAERVPPRPSGPPVRPPVHSPPGAPVSIERARPAPAPRPLRVAALLGLLGAAALALAAVAYFRSRSDDPTTRSDTPTLPPAPERPATEPAGATPGAQRETSTPEPEPETAARAPETAAPETPAVPLRDFDPTPDTSGEDLTRIEQWTEEWLTADAGDEPRRQLLAQGRKAVPAILNAFQRQDCSTPAGLSIGSRCQEALAEIGNGARFDEQLPGAAGCRKALATWTQKWSLAEQSIDVWIELARLDQEDPDEARRLRERFGGQQPPEDVEDE